MMKLYWGMVCALGAVACSTNKPAAEPYAYSSNVQVTDPVATTDTSESTSVADAEHAHHSDVHAGADYDRSPPSDPSLVGADGRSTQPSSDARSTDAQRVEAQRTEAQRVEAQRVEAQRVNSATPTTGSNAGNANNTTKANPNKQDTASWTAADQGQGQGDIKITQQIRQALMGDSSLSFVAKNAQIITRDGRVVLRGQVKNSQERSTIDSIARKVAAPGQVDNFLEIKP